MKQQYLHGPKENQHRNCTDFFCLIIFVLLTITVYGTAIYCWQFGPHTAARVPFDSDGKTCGVDYSNYPLIYFTNPNADNLWMTVCVSKCPSSKDLTLSCKTNSVIKNCTNATIYQSYALSNVFCMPTSSTLQNNLKPAVIATPTQQFLISTMNSWKIIVSSICITTALTAILIVLSSAFKKIMFWILFIIGILGLMAGAIVFLQHGSQFSLFQLENNYTGNIVVASISIAFSVFIAALIIANIKTAHLGVLFLKTSAEFVGDSCIVYLLPFIFACTLVMFYLILLAASIAYYSIGIQIKKNHQMPFPEYYYPTWIKIVITLSLVYSFWVISFLIESINFIISGTATLWNYKLQNQFQQSRYRYWRYHMGSVCLSSFLSLFIGPLKFLYEILPCKNQENQDTWKSKLNKFYYCICCACSNTIFKYYHTNAFTIIHLTSQSYCTSAQQVHRLIQQDMTDAQLHFNMKTLCSTLLGIVCAYLTSIMCYCLLVFQSPYNYTVSSPMIPTILIFIGSYTLNSFILSVQMSSASAIYMCFLAECDAGTQSNCPHQLKQYLYQTKVVTQS